MAGAQAHTSRRTAGEQSSPQKTARLAAIAGPYRPVLACALRFAVRRKETLSR